MIHGRLDLTVILLTCHFFRQSQPINIKLHSEKKLANRFSFAKVPSFKPAKLNAPKSVSKLQKFVYSFTKN